MTTSETGGPTTTNGNGHHHVPLGPTYTADSLTSDVLGVFARPSQELRTWTMITGAFLVLGIVGLVIKATTAGGNPQRWGYYVATIGFIFSTFQAAPIAAVATRLAKGDWRRPFTRVAEIFTVAGFLTFLLLIPALAILPNHLRDAQGVHDQSTVWFNWPGSPYLWEGLAFLFLPIVGFGMLYISSLPDLGAARDLKIDGAFVKWGAKWRGTFKQWRIVRSGLTPLGSMYLAMFVFTGLLFFTDFSMSQVPGWYDAIAPAYYSIAGLQGGLATLILGLALLRRTNFRQYIGLDQFWGLAKLLLALSLLWFYFWWSAFILFWYGRIPRELALLELLMFGPYVVPFVVSWFCSFGIPLLCLMWNPVRKSIRGPIIVSCFILVGNLFNHIRLFVGPLSLPTHVGGELHAIPEFMPPDFADLLIVPGFIGGAVFACLMAARLFPMMSIWELKEGLLYRHVRQYLRAFVTVVAKPE